MSEMKARKGRDLISIEEVCERAGRSPYYWRAKARAGLLPFARTIQEPQNSRTEYFFVREEFEAWLRGGLPSSRQAEAAG